MSVPSPSDPVIQELTSLDARVAEVLKDRDSASRLLQLVAVASGANLIQLLREKYEAVRLDLQNSA
jgi:hypothetical protein